MIEAKRDNLKPIGYQIYVKLDPKTEEVGGIIIPERYRVHGWNATVVRVGNRVDNGLKSGDEILLMKSYTTVLNKNLDYAIMDSRFVMAKLIFNAKDRKYSIHPINKFVLSRPDESIDKVGNIHLSDKAIKSASRGEVLSASMDCDTVKMCEETMHIYYQTKLAIKCNENGALLNLLSENDIEMVTYG